MHKLKPPSISETSVLVFSTALGANHCARHSTLDVTVGFSIA